MRKITTVITQILDVLPVIPDSVIADQMTTLKAELRLQLRQGMYLAPEGESDAWERLSITLYRYMPQPGSYPFVQQVSDIVTDPSSGAPHA